MFSEVEREGKDTSETEGLVEGAEEMLRPKFAGEDFVKVEQVPAPCQQALGVDALREAGHKAGLGDFHGEWPKILAD